MNFREPIIIIRRHAKTRGQAAKKTELFQQTIPSAKMIRICLPLGSSKPFTQVHRVLNWEHRECGCPGAPNNPQSTRTEHGRITYYISCSTIHDHIANNNKYTQRINNNNNNNVYDNAKLLKYSSRARLLDTRILHP